MKRSPRQPNRRPTAPLRRRGYPARMRYVEVDGLRTSVIGLGAWQFGSREWGYGEGYATETAPALVRRALELGITMLDTAEMYGPGRSERIIAGALAQSPGGPGRPPRRDEVHADRPG